MILILTSSPSGPLDKPNDDRLLDYKNGFVDNLKLYWKEHMNALMISADPNNYSGNDEMISLARTISILDSYMNKFVFPCKCYSLTFWFRHYRT